MENPTLKYPEEGAIDCFCGSPSQVTSWQPSLLLPLAVDGMADDADVILLRDTREIAAKQQSYAFDRIDMLVRWSSIAC